MISVIVPVYNVAAYLGQCLQSIAEQTFNDWECILVDDGSTDGSSRICDEWADKDHRFKVVHKTNKGVSIARNEGLKACSGTYVVFVDSDDWVETDYLSAMYHGISEDVDLVVTGVNECYKSHDRRLAPNDDKTICLEADYTEDFVHNIGFHYGPSSKLFRASIIREKHVEFPLNCSLGEDLEFNFSYLHHIKRIHYLPLTNYNYRMHESGSLVTTRRDDVFDIHYRQWHVQKELLVQKGMWLKCARDYLYSQMWAIVYEGIFTAKTPNLKLYRRILRVPEIDYLKSVSETFNAAKCVKYAIMSRRYLLLFILLKIRKCKGRK